MDAANTTGRYQIVSVDVSLAMHNGGNSVIVIGGGPAGLRAAEVANAAGSRVVVCDAQRSVGRKFLVAGRGGLNLTHGEPVDNFPARYGAEENRWKDLLGQFGPEALRSWAGELGVETYIGTSGRVFPRGQKAAGLLRNWLRRLRASGVQFRSGCRLRALVKHVDGWSAHFENADEDLILSCNAIVLALGGASWPETGSDGTWPGILSGHGVEINPWTPANCGWEVAWPQTLLDHAEGLPLKNLTVRAGDESVSGELLITKHGLEGGAIYRLGPTLRKMSKPRIEIDLKAQLSPETLRDRVANLADPQDWFRIWKLSTAMIALLENMFPEDCHDREQLIVRLKTFPIRLTGPRPIAEAISSAGGVAWSELDESLMLRKMAGVFVAGEMIDWEAPTGGYLLQGCFATGTRAGGAAARYTFTSSTAPARAISHTNPRNASGDR